jgi:vancomycin resistance protein YoaR
MTTGTLTRGFARPFRPTSFRQSVLGGFVAGIAGGVLLVAGAATALAVSTGSAALPNVSVGGVSLSGLDRDEAAARLSADLPSVSSGTALVAVDDETYDIGYAELGRRYDVDAMLDRAFGVGRDGGLLADALTHLRAPFHATALPVAVHPFDADALSDFARGVSARASRAPIAAAVSREGANLTVHPASDGWVLEPATVESAVADALAGVSPADVRVELATTTVEPAVTTAMATEAAAAAEAMMRDLALEIPGAPEDEEAPTLSRATIASWIGFDLDASGTYAPTIDQAALVDAIAGLRDMIDRDPVDAGFTVAAGGGIGGVIAGQDGRDLQVPQAIASVRRALAQRAAGASVPSLSLPVALTQPGLTTDVAATALPQMQLVSSWTTYYTPNEGNGFGNNISIGAWDLDGYTIAPGEWFSFWGGIGPVTLERGYRYGGAIINGRSVPNGALAGGICSTSTTLFNAAMRFGLEIGERENHFYYINRYPTGLDATVAIVNNDVTDMTFRNDTDQPIVIRGFGTPGQVTFQMWSVPNGRSVVLGAPVTSSHVAARDTTIVDPSMAPGSARRVEFPHDGFNVSVSRWVYGADGTLLHQNNWFSDYRAVNGITLVGPAAPAPPPDEDDEAPPDEEA